VTRSDRVCSMHSVGPKFSVVEDKGKYKVRDAEGTKYGSYDTRKDAEFYMKLWEEYYESAGN
jgi:hypothetical protein